ncbi:hypothetical protein AB0L75_37190 [Streptomyces sp. NPDC052101]|uniref:hypothetical protein n=1 Tax=Streptomyces sp. NPDC052101 TaxID=3155763 RepID=UPI00342CD9E5
MTTPRGVTSQQVLGLGDSVGWSTKAPAERASAAENSASAGCGRTESRTETSRHSAGVRVRAFVGSGREVGAS